LIFDAATLGAAPAAADPSAASCSASDGGHVLDNGLLRVVVDARGLVTSVLDGDREVLAGPANLLQIHPDLPHYWDAWDVDHTYRTTVTDLVDAVSVSAVDGGIQVVRRFGDSSVTQTITLPPAARRVEFTTSIDWHEREKFLKVAFPLDLHADRSAAETQFGHIHRPTDQNTSWEFARFEICAHRFLHVAEPGYGIALVNDSTYGHDVTRDGTTTTVRLSLLRAPRYPDPETDQGEHTLRYALVPDADMVDAVWAGITFNLPERRIPGSSPVEPLLSVDHDGVVVSAVKLADDGSGDVVVRVYEALGGRARARLTLGFAATSVETTDLLERPLPDGTAELDTDGVVALALRPFQILTLRFRRAS
jgi:alpha-mannosidase